MKSRIMYLECKTERGDRGGARICRVTFSRTGRTVRYHGLELQPIRGFDANYLNLKTGLEYWVSGPKKNGQDRHWAGGGKVHIDPDVADEYWRTIRGCKPPKRPYLA